MSTDPTAITTEIPATTEAPAVSAGSAPVTVPSGGFGGQGAGVEPCPHCGAELALDQRYCLTCGAPRTYLSGMLLERLRAQSAPALGAPPSPPVASMPPGAGAMPPFGAGATPPLWQRGNVLTLIAGIGVLLLAMGVGVLIGRSGGSGSSGSPAPQVITVGGAPAAGTATTPTTSTVSEEPASTKTGAGTSTAKHKSSKATESGVGSSPSKPAPPSVLKNEKSGGSGQSYEQKSKNLPDVVETG